MSFMGLVVVSRVTASIDITVCYLRDKYPCYVNWMREKLDRNWLLCKLYEAEKDEDEQTWEKVVNGEGESNVDYVIYLCKVIGF